MFFGHDEKISIFKKLAVSERLGQSYLFFGDRGVGKATFAKRLGYFLEFGKFENGQEIAIDTVVFAPNEKNVIGIDDALNARRFLWETPLRSSRRFAIIDGAESLTPEAQSAMLKIVEEPPLHALLVFVAYDAEALFPPLLSRLTKVYFPKFSNRAIAEILEKNYDVSADKAKCLGADSFGSLGRALEALEDKKTVDEADLAVQIEGEILNLRRLGLQKNAKKISFLLQRLVVLKRFNLNESLFKKALRYELQKLSK